MDSSVENSLDAGSDHDDDDDSEVVHKEIEVFQEDSTALQMAQEEERMLRDLMDKQRASMGLDRDSMLDDAIRILDKVEVERHNDHGKPWKPPPPVTYSTEYWKNWRARVSVDKSNAETPEEIEAREKQQAAERRRNRPPVRAPLPTQFDRRGKKTAPVANFSQPFYNELADPRVKPKKAARRRAEEDGRALKEVKQMMRTFGVDETKYPATSDSLSAAVATATEMPPRKNLDRAIGFSTGTREDWNKVISVGKQPYGNQSGKGNAPPTQYNLQEALKTTLPKAPRTVMMGRPSDKLSQSKTPGAVYARERKAREQSARAKRAQNRARAARRATPTATPTAEGAGGVPLYLLSETKTALLLLLLLLSCGRSGSRLGLQGARAKRARRRKRERSEGARAKRGSASEAR
jgi:hypothetical protein